MNKDLKKNLFSTLTVASFLLSAAPALATHVTKTTENTNLQSASNAPQHLKLAQGVEGTCCCACK